MVIGRSFFADENEKRDYVLECEGRFEAALDDAVARIHALDDCKVITLSGPSCSGKTTTANKLVHDLTEMGRRVHVVSLDDYYFDREKLLADAARDGEEIDFDSPDTIDLDELRRTVDHIADGDRVKIPKYDFVTGKRTGFRSYTIGKSDTFIFEGIQAVYPNVTDLLDEHDYTGIFISVASDLEIAGRIFGANYIRFYRRLVRDYNFRNATPEFTFKIWESVRANEEKHILPYAGKCDIQINSLLPYEISMIKPFALPLLRMVGEDSKYYAAAKRAEERMDGIEAISRSFMPEHSVYREFLG